MEEIKSEVAEFCDVLSTEHGLSGAGEVFVFKWLEEHDEKKRDRIIEIIESFKYNDRIGKRLRQDDDLTSQLKSAHNDALDMILNYLRN